MATTKSRRRRALELDRIGARGLRPLLEALRDEKDVAQQRIAVQVLGHLGNKGAAQPLVHMARQEPRRARASSARSPRRPIAKFASTRSSQPAASAIRACSTTCCRSWSTTRGRDARSGDVHARPHRRQEGGRRALIKALDDRRASVQALACLGLAQIDDAARRRADRHRSTTRAASTDARRLRLCDRCAQGDARGVPALLAALDDNRGEAQRLAAWALGQLADRKALGPLVRAYFARAGRNPPTSSCGRSVASAARASRRRRSRARRLPDARAASTTPAKRIATMPGDLPHARTGGQARRRSRRRYREGPHSRRSPSIATSSCRCSPISMRAPIGSRSARSRRGQRREGDGGARDDRQRDRAADRRAAHQRGSEGPRARGLGAREDGRRQAQEADAVIAKALADPAEQVRASAMISVAVLRTRRGLAPPAWSPRLARRSNRVRGPTAALPRSRWGHRTRRRPAALIKAAKDPSSFVREAVAVALGQFGTPAAPTPERSRQGRCPTGARKPAQPHESAFSSQSDCLRSLTHRFARG